MSEDKKGGSSDDVGKLLYFLKAKNERVPPGLNGPSSDICFNSGNITGFTKHG